MQLWKMARKNNQKEKKMSEYEITKQLIEQEQRITRIEQLLQAILQQEEEENEEKQKPRGKQPIA